MIEGEVLDVNQYRKTRSKRRSKLQHLKDSRLVMQLSLRNQLKLGVKTRMKL